MEQLIEQEKFCAKYNIDKDNFKKSGITWGEMEDIYADYTSKIPMLETAARTISEILRNHKDVHTVRSRVKNPEHLIEKIIRKTIEKKDKEAGFQITLKNYTQKITDSIGLRVLHLYKDQAFQIDKMIRENWEPEEKVTIYHRKGDDNSLADGQDPALFEHKEHPVGYRSWHYLIKSQITKHHYIAEIQVRTIFEEGWSEIDHQLRYPYHVDNELLKNQLLVLNRIAGSADEMVNNIKETLITLDVLNKEKEERDSLIASLQDEVKALSKKSKVEGADFSVISDTLKKLKEVQQTAIDFSDLKVSIPPNIGNIIYNSNESYGLNNDGFVEYESAEQNSSLDSINQLEKKGT
ncbi:pXO1-131 [Priestia megaterium]|uniref:hypothetical protein n=1 Tax=Priestia megaterium TaxID=1404 RepID=UPI000E135E04|nr:hypothetical protein [Priestia megaterium]SUV06360.1 pXO1-131 [Priestia megaterium]